MAKRKTTRYLTERRRTHKVYYVWQPSSKLARHGWKSVYLNDRLGNPSTHADAIKQHHWLNAILDAMRDGDRTTARGLIDAWSSGEGAVLYQKRWPALTACDFVPYAVPHLDTSRPLRQAEARSVSRLIEMWQASIWFTSKANSTRIDYASHLRRIDKWCGSYRVDAVRRKAVRKYYETLVSAKSLHVANARIRVLSSLMSFAVEEEWIDANPILKFKMVQAPGRIRLVHEDEQAALIQAADDAGRYSVGDAIVLARFIGQRRGDIVRLTDANYTGQAFKLRQSKTGKVVHVDAVPELAERMDKAQRRNRAVHGDLEARLATAKATHTTWDHLKDFHGAALIVNEDNGLPYHPHTFSHKFAAIRLAATEAVPSLAGVKFLDFRDTAVIHLARAECTLFEVCSITGHTPASVQMICRSYLETQDNTLAANAVGKLLKAMGASA